MTLKANELRIGNFYDHNGFVNEATPNTIEEVWIAERSWVKPIPLTKEWLLKFDAIKIGDEFIFDRFRLKYRPDYKFYYVTCRETNAYITKVEFVHEWQNVVFALNNQELTLKNNSNN